MNVFLAATKWHLYKRSECSRPPAGRSQVNASGHGVHRIVAVLIIVAKAQLLVNIVTSGLSEFSLG